MLTGSRAEDGEECASELLSKLCEDVGFSEEEWGLRLRMCDVRSTSGNYNDGTLKLLRSGSSSEGLSAEILGSDIDIMNVLTGIKVTESDEISSDEEDDVYNAITSTHHAFYKIILRHKGNGLSYNSRELRLCLEYDPHSKMPVLNGTQLKKRHMAYGNGVVNNTIENGPAVTHSTTYDGQQIDTVISLHCPFWPIVSEPWKDRSKPYGWPPPKLIEGVTKFGCEFVAKGHDSSIHKELEWRLSSSVAESVLIRSFNIVQIQCYFLLKLVRVYLIKVPKALCSYHMKNIILWQMEKTDPRTWRRDKLAQRFTDCLMALHLCLENGNLPQYFIPEQNLFDPKIQRDVRTTLIRVVGELVQEGWRCLLRCTPFTYTGIGCVHNVTRCPCYIRQKSNEREKRNVGLVREQLRSIVIRIMESLDGSTQNYLDQTLSKIKTLRRTTEKDELYTELYRPSKPSNDVINTAMSYHMGFMMMSENNSDVDLTSGRLKLATFYYGLGQVDKCIRIVEDALLKFTEKTVVLNADPIRQDKYGKTDSIFEKWLGLLSISDDIRGLLRNVIFPVMFSPWEIINAPPAVRDLRFNRKFESIMERGISLTVVAIDSLVYAYYLLTISYRSKGQHDQAKTSLDNLRRVLRSPKQHQVYYPYEGDKLLTSCT